MEKSIFKTEEVIQFFETSCGIRFIDADTKKPALKVIAQNKKKQKSDYDVWLEQQDEETKESHRMSEI
jgi:hypothetical protein